MFEMVEYCEFVEFPYDSAVFLCDSAAYLLLNSAAGTSAVVVAFSAPLLSSFVDARQCCSGYSLQYTCISINKLSAH